MKICIFGKETEMKKNLISLAVAVMAAPAFSASMADTIAIDYQGSGAEFVRLVSSRLDMPFLNLASGRDAQISVRQDEGRTVEQALLLANRSMQDQGVQVGIWKTPLSEKLLVMYEPGKLPDLDTYFKRLVAQTQPAQALVQAPHQTETVETAAADIALEEKADYAAIGKMPFPHTGVERPAVQKQANKPLFAGFTATVTAVEAPLEKPAATASTDNAVPFVLYGEVRPATAVGEVMEAKGVRFIPDEELDLADRDELDAVSAGFAAAKRSNYAEVAKVTAADTDKTASTGTEPVIEIETVAVKVVKDEIGVEKVSYENGRLSVNMKGGSDNLIVEGRYRDSTLAQDDVVVEGIKGNLTLIQGGKTTVVAVG